MKPSNQPLGILILLLCLALPIQSQASTLYASGNGNMDLVSIDSVTGAGTNIGPFTAGGAAPLAATPDGRLWTVDSFTNTLQQVDPASGVTTPVGTGTGTLAVASMAYDDSSGIMYLLDAGPNLYSINLSTGVATLVGPSLCLYGMESYGGTMYGLEYCLDPNGTVVTIDTASGLPTPGPVISGPAAAVFSGLAIDPVTGEAFMTGSDGNLYTLNLATGATAIKSTPGTGVMLGSAFVPAQPPAGITLSLNFPEPMYRAGDTMTLTATTTSGTPPVNADVWIRLALPNSSYLYLTTAGLSATPAPILNNWPVANFSRNVFTHIFNGSEPLGNFTWQAALTQPGKFTYIGQPSTAPFSHQPPLAGRLVINEVDYDNVGTDSNEFIEIYNAGNAVMDLNGIMLSLVNGVDSTEYSLIDLSPAAFLNPGAYLVVASATVIVDPQAAVITFPMATNNIQNGAPDGIALVDTNTGTLLDALSYEGSIPAATVTGIVGTVNLVEGTPTSAIDDPAIAGSLIRNPNGTDTNDAMNDWIFTLLPTPGVANVFQ